MGRRAYSSPRKRVNVYVEESLLTEFQLIHYDPIRGKSEYGQFSIVINDLLRKYLQEHRQNVK